MYKGIILATDVQIPIDILDFSTGLNFSCYPGYLILSKS